MLVTQGTYSPFAALPRLCLESGELLPPARALLLKGFAEVSVASYQELLEWDHEARAADFTEPA